MLPARRQGALRLLSTARATDIPLCREVEAACHAASLTADEYYDHVRRAAFNLHENGRIGIEVVYLPDSELTEGTLLGRIETESRARTERFENMLKEKYDALNDRTFQAIVRCRRCGSHEVGWSEKQTRSADESATVFCTCTVCKNRWTMR
jgi:transcription elongation factor S-II